MFAHRHSFPLLIWSKISSVFPLVHTDTSARMLDTVFEKIQVNSGSTCGSGMNKPVLTVHRTLCGCADPTGDHPTLRVVMDVESFITARVSQICSGD